MAKEELRYEEGPAWDEGKTRNEDGMAKKGKRKYRLVIITGLHITAQK